MALCIAAASSQDWDSLKVEEMSADWEEGDDERELEHEYERTQRIAKEKAKKASKIMQSGKPKDFKKLVTQLVAPHVVYICIPFSIPYVSSPTYIG